MDQQTNQQSSDKTERIELHAGSQAAIQALVQRNRAANFRGRVIRLLIVLAIILTVPPLFFTFYCGTIIGTTYERTLLRNYPNATKLMIRGSVLTDRWYLNTGGRLLSGVQDFNELKLREAVIELGLEQSRDGVADYEKIHTLREDVGQLAAKNPDAWKRTLTFTVYELPPARHAANPEPSP